MHLITNAFLAFNKAWIVEFFFKSSGLTNTIFTRSDFRTSKLLLDKTTADNPRETILDDRLSFMLLRAVMNKHFGFSGSPKLSLLFTSSTKYGKRHGGRVLPLLVHSENN